MDGCDGELELLELLDRVAVVVDVVLFELDEVGVDGTIHGVKMEGGEGESFAKGVVMGL